MKREMTGTTDWSRLPVPAVAELRTVVGPRGGQIHYVVLNRDDVAVCNKLKPQAGWTYTTDEDNNRNRAAWCEACMRKAPY